MDNEFLTFNEALEFFKKSPSCLRHIIRFKKVNSVKVNGKLLIEKKSITSYLENRWKRSNSKINSEYVFDKSKQEYSVLEACEILNIPRLNIYHYLREGWLKFFRKENSKAIIINYDEILVFKNSQIYKAVQYRSEKRKR